MTWGSGRGGRKRSGRGWSAQGWRLCGGRWEVRGAQTPRSDPSTPAPRLAAVRLLSSEARAKTSLLCDLLSLYKN